MEPKLFSPQFNEHAEEFKKYLPVNINLRFETVSSHLALCEETYIRPLLGAELFDRLADHVADNSEEVEESLVPEPAVPENENENSEESPVAVLVDKVRFALIRLAIWKGYDIIASNISDTGVSAEVDKENRLFRYQEENIKRTLKEEGFNYLDNILEFLEENAQDFLEFAQSDYALESTQSLIRNTRMFNTYYNIDNSRLVFLKMRHYIRDVEHIELQHRIGTDFYQELLAADESLPKYESILSYIRNYIVYAAVAEGIGELHKLPTEKGLLFETTTMDGVQETPVYRAQIMETRARFAQRAEQYLAAAINHIKANIAEYSAYAAFAGDSPEDGIIHRDNTNRKIFLA